MIRQRFINPTPKKEVLSYTPHSEIVVLAGIVEAIGSRRKQLHSEEKCFKSYLSK